MIIATLDWGFIEDTAVLLIVGRVLHRQPIARSTIRAIAARARLEAERMALPIAAVPGGDCRDALGIEEVYDRVAIGRIVAVAFAEDRAPIRVPEEAFTTEDALSDAFWAEIAGLLPPGTGMPQSPAALRASAASTGHGTIYDGVALDREELRAGPSGLHLISTGTLCGGSLARGELAPMPDDEDEDVDLREARKGLVYGQDMSQESHPVAVRGERLLWVGYDGVQSRLVEVAKGEAYFLVARYD